MDRLKDKVALITGGASGIGLGIGKAFAKEGARVCVADISQERCDAAAKEIGHGAFGQALDVRDRASIDALVARVVKEAGRIEVLVNSAGVFSMQAITDVTEAEFDRVYSINARGLLFVTQAVAKCMIAGKTRGAMINIASGVARRGQPGAAVYSSSKMAVVGITQSAAMELIHHGIRVNAIAPGTVLTPMWTEQVEPVFNAVLGPDGGNAVEANVRATPAGRMSTPDDYTGMAIYLASGESDFVVGQTFNVDGGMFLN